MRYQVRRNPQVALRVQLKELAASRVRYGYRRLTVLLKREGWKVNAKRVYRLYNEEGLTVRTKQRKKLASRARVPLAGAVRPNQRWSMDFIQERTEDGRSSSRVSAWRWRWIDDRLQGGRGRQEQGSAKHKF